MKKKIPMGYVRKIHEVSANDISDVLVGAFEGGSNYWIEKVFVKDDDYKGAKYSSDVISKGGELIVKTMDNDTKRLTDNMMVAGIQKYIDEGGKHFPFNGSADAYTYDTILQYALFDEIVYG
jgi:hypothetical protein|tara:strand:+ start:782 stop:1147 length:366 start_codon:yes stop_codon:yes gene_type:complete